MLFWVCSKLEMSVNCSKSQAPAAASEKISKIQFLFLWTYPNPTAPKNLEKYQNENSDWTRKVMSKHDFFSFFLLELLTKKFQCFRTPHEFNFTNKSFLPLATFSFLSNFPMVLSSLQFSLQFQWTTEAKEQHNWNVCTETLTQKFGNFKKLCLRKIGAFVYEQCAHSQWNIYRIANCLKAKKCRAKNSAFI